jgi:hypothetical protein
VLKFWRKAMSKKTVYEISVEEALNEIRINPSEGLITLNSPSGQNNDIQLFNGDKTRKPGMLWIALQFDEKSINQLDVSFDNQVM